MTPTILQNSKLDGETPTTNLLCSGRRPRIRIHLRGLLRVRGGGGDAAPSAASDDVAAAAPILAQHEGAPESAARILSKREHEGAPESVARTGEEPFFRG